MENIKIFHGREAIRDEIKDFAKIRESTLSERDVVCYACDVYANSNLPTQHFLHLTKDVRKKIFVVKR